MASVLKIEKLLTPEKFFSFLCSFDILRLELEQSNSERPETEVEQKFEKSRLFFASRSSGKLDHFVVSLIGQRIGDSTQWRLAPDKNKLVCLEQTTPN